MATTHNIHDDIEPWLAAAVHDQLSDEERAAFQEHLASCERCRTLHKEELHMSTLIANSLQAAKPDLAFERRILSGFRRKLPERHSIFSSLVKLFHSRAMQRVGGVALLLCLVIVGAFVTTAPDIAPGKAAVRAMLASNSLAGLRARLDPAGVKRTQTFLGIGPDSEPVEGLRRLPSKVGATAEEAQRELPVTVYSANASQQAGSTAPAASPEFQEEQPNNAASTDSATAKRVVVTGSYIPPEENEKSPSSPGPDSNRKLVRNAQVELEVVKFDEAVQKITALVTEQRGYVATSSSEKQANGKLRGEVVVKVLPETLDAFLLKLRDLGELKNQTLATDDVTKQYFDTDSRLKNARVMETRLIEILKTKSNKVADLLEVEKELGRVRASIEEMQGALKYMDAQVQFATVTITLAEKDMNLPAAFLLKRRAQLALFSTDVEKTFEEVKGVIDGTKAQISSSTLDRDSAGEATARLVLLIAPEEADALISRIKGMGRVQNYNEQTDRIAQGGSGMAEGAKVERDKVQLSITISRNEQEPALQTTTLSILTSGVIEKVARLKENAAKSSAEIRSSSFSRNPDGQEIASITLRVPMKNYAALLGSFDQLGKVKDVSVRRDDRRGVINEETAPADISIEVYSQPNIVSDESGLFATIRNTLAQGASALLWSLRMIGVALAFLAPWALALVVVSWLVRRIARARKTRDETRN